MGVIPSGFESRRPHQFFAVIVGLSMPTMQRRSLALLTAAAFAAAMLAGCAMSDDSLSSFLVAPGKYVLYNCDDIAREAKTIETRLNELEQLRAKAGSEGAGALIGNATYGTDIATARGRLRDLRAAAAEKNCGFVPGAANPTERPSGRAIH